MNYTHIHIQHCECSKRTKNYEETKTCIGIVVLLLYGVLVHMNGAQLHEKHAHRLPQVDVDFF